MADGIDIILLEDEEEIDTQSDFLKGDKGDKGDQGIPGQRGETGNPGQDGYTPEKGIDYFTDEEIAEIESTIETAVIEEITPTLEGKQDEITNSNKLDSDLINDTNQTNRFTTTSEKSSWNNKYDKPSSGIPKTDLSSDVQESLGKADTAIQSHQDISGKEDKSNKVNSINDESTNSQYPSAKCVYDSQEAQNEIIQSMIPETIKVTGNSITLNNIAKMNYIKAPIPRGNIEQNSYSGKNKLPNNATTSQTIGGIQYTVNDDKSISFSGTSTATSDLYIVGSASEYVDLGLSTGSYNINGCSNGSLATYMLYVVQNRSGTLSYYQSVSSTGLNISIQSGDTFRIFIRVINGQTVNAKIYPQLEEGSTATSYEPYCGGTASPNPDYPQEIKKVTGDVEVLVQNKNFMFLNDIPETTEKGVTYSCQDGILTINGTLTSGLLIDFNNFNLLAGDYFFSSTIENATGSYARYFIDTTDTSKNKTNGGSISISETNQVHFRFYANSGASFNNSKIYAQLEYGSTATSYTEHEQQTYPLTLGDIELCKIGDYQDYIYKENDKWYLHKEIGKVVLDGSENYSYAAGNKYTLLQDLGIIAKDINTTGYLLSDYFKEYGNAETDNHNYGICRYGATSTYNYQKIVIKNIDFSNIDNFKTWLSTHNTEVYYVLANPVITEITNTTLINELEDILNATSYEEQTNISGISDEANPNFEVEAYRYRLPDYWTTYVDSKIGNAIGGAY